MDDILIAKPFKHQRRDIMNNIKLNFARKSQTNKNTITKRFDHLLMNVKIRNFQARYVEPKDVAR